MTRHFRRALISTSAAALVLGCVGVSGAAAAELQVGQVGQALTFSSTQPNIWNCIEAVDGSPSFKGAGKSPIQSVTFNFKKANTCEGVRFSVNVVDANGAISVGHVQPLAIGAQRKVVVKMDSGTANKNAKPQAFVNIS